MNRKGKFLTGVLIVVFAITIVMVSPAGRRSAEANGNITSSGAASPGADGTNYLPMPPNRPTFDFSKLSEEQTEEAIQQIDEKSLTADKLQQLNRGVVSLEERQALLVLFERRDALATHLLELKTKTLEGEVRRNEAVHAQILSRLQADFKKRGN